MLILLRTTLLLGAILLATAARAQQPTPTTTTKTLTVSPIVGEVIDLEEKKKFGLFPQYSADTFKEARFVQYLNSEGGNDAKDPIMLLTTLVSGEVQNKLFTNRDFLDIGNLIERRQKELETYLSPKQSAITSDSLGGNYAVELLSGSSFVGKLIAQRENELDFMTKDLGRLTVQKANIRRLQLLTTSQALHGWEPVGNGTRVFFAPTARPLRRGEGYVQNIDIFLLGANYGITDNVSLGVLVPVLPGFGFSVFALTPKVSFQVQDKLHVGGGVLYASDFRSGGGVGYGVATYGSADNNITLGLGYGFASGDFSNSPVVVVGGATRISRRISLLNETYIYNEGLAGLIGLRIAAARISGSLGALYITNGGGIYPAYAEVAYRFGKMR
jgi:hypothetical protein